MKEGLPPGVGLEEVQVEVQVKKREEILADFRGHNKRFLTGAGGEAQGN